MKYISIISAGVVSLATLIPDVQAVEVPFTTTILSSCILVVGNAGLFGLNATGDVLDSKLAGGLSGSVLATSTGGGYLLSVASPGAFTLAPSGGGDNVTFASTYSLAGATSTGETPESTTTALNLGISTVSVDLAATKSTGIFGAGLYSAAVTVTCESS